MNGAALLLLALGMAAALANWIAVGRGAKALEYVAKPLTLALFIGAALALDPADDTVRAWFVLALVLCLVGDIVLMLPRDLFVFGLAAFLLGHLAYVVGLQLDGQSGRWFVAGLAVVLVGVVVVGVRVVRAVRADGPAMVGPVTAYMAVISLMVACAFGTGDGFAIAGALLFYGSDALIAWNRFVRPAAWAGVVIMVTYHLGQLGLVLSLS